VSDYGLCPTCSDQLSKDGLCGSCGYGKKQPVARMRTHVGPLHDAATSARLVELAQMARSRYEFAALSSSSMTEQQWYNVCKFWPSVAEHCKRQRPDVGPHHPLDATSKAGPLMGQLRKRHDAEAIAEREAMQLCG
jgi:hypothetical protein